MAVLALALLAGCRTVVGPAGPPPDDPRLAWAALLSEAVTPEGLVDYDRIEADRAVLDAYVGWIGNGKLARSRDGETAFWLNAHTALGLWLVLEEGRPASVYDVPALAWWPGGPPFFRQRAFRVGLERLSIGEIEDERLRLQTQDVRLHAALWRATRSGPPLRAELWSEATLDAQLSDQMQRWVDDPVRGVRVEGDTAVFSATFDDYGRDFDQWTAGDDLCTLAARHATEPLRTELDGLAARGCPHRFAPADLALDDALRYSR